ncbi:MAG: glycoside hydrolase family 2 TIM barrel-domain containing protein [Candidatus Omnitrophota bacterium]|jgi:hypothetical protein
MHKRYPAFVLIAVLFACAHVCPAQDEPKGSVVKVTGQKGSWSLEVNGKPFYIKGVGVGNMKGKYGEDYLKMAQELGANAVRTWGTDQGTQEYFDTAYKYGLMVDAGIWINFVKDDGKYTYIGDNDFKKNKKKEIEDYVNKFKGHPALLMWNVGNEAIFFTKDEEERVELSKFLEEMIKLVHRLDPAHPVIYTSADTTALPYIIKYVPSLDIFGMNIYGSVRMSHSKWDKSGLDIPYCVTEYGPHGPWDAKKDANGASQDEPDQGKAALYRNMTNDIMGFKGYDLGGFVFHLGETTQESMTWWNINYKLFKRPAFWEVYKIYTGSKPSNLPPRIVTLKLTKTKGIAPGEKVDIFAEASDNDSNPLDYQFMVSTAQEGILEYYVNKEVDVKIDCEGTSFRMTAPGKKGLYRLYLIVNDGYGNVAVANRSFKVE